MNAILEKTVMLVIVLIVLIFVIKFTTDYYAGAKERAELQQCKNSVYAHAGMNFKYADFSSSIKCPPKDIVIEGNEREAMIEIGDRMSECWDMFGEGELDLFDDPNSDKNYCHLCYYVEFEDVEPIRMVDYVRFMNDFPTKYGETYAHYLYGDEMELPVYRNNVTYIYTGMPYGIMFVFKKKSNAIFYKTVSVVGGVVLVAGGVALAYFSGGLLSVVGGYIAKTGVALAAGGVVAGIATYTASGGLGNQDFEAGIEFMPYTEDIVEQLNCQELPVRGGK